LIYVDSELLHKALTVYEQHQDKSWGLVDCASFVLMQDKNVYQALTSDRHFEQAGFRCLLPAR